MTTPGPLPSHILDTLHGKIPLGSVDITAFSETANFEDGCQEVRLGFSPTEHVVRIAMHKDDLPSVEMEMVDDYLIYTFCGQNHVLTLAIQPVEPENIGHLKDALAGVVEDLTPQGDAPAA